MLGKHTLAPKEKTSLTITFDTKDSPGPFRKTATISTDIPGRQEMKVTIEGTVREAPAPKIQVKPRRVDLGAVQRGSILKQELAITNTGSLPLVIKRVYLKESGTAFFDAAGGGDMVIEPAATRTLEVAIRADKTGAPSEEFILIESNAKNAPKGGYVIIVQYSSE